MPGLIPQVGELIEVRSLCLTSDQIALNVTHWQVVVLLGGGVDLTAIAGQFDLDLNVAYKAFMSANASYRGFGARNLAEPRTLEFSAVGNSGVGTVASAANLPTQTTGLIHILTDMAGRANRGRIYPGFPAGSFIDLNGRMNAAGVTQLAAIATAYGTTKSAVSGLAATGIRLMVRHPDTGSPPARVTHADAASAILPGDKFATQRRRGQLGRTNIAPF